MTQSIGRLKLYRSLLLVLVPVILSASGCGYLGFYTRQATWKAVFETRPRLAVLRRFAPEDSLLVNGRIVNLKQQRGALLLAAVSSRYRENEIVAFTTIRDLLEEYTLFLPKGDYGLFVFADLNGNGLFERNELVGHADMIVDASRTRDDGITEGPTIAVNYQDPLKTVFRLRVKVRAADYVYSSLDDEFFDSRYGDEGLYYPAGLMAHTQGFMFGLETYDERKTTLLFVHGIGGTPRDWKYFVEGLDRSRFQPFFFYYPSGMPLDMLGSLLAQVIDSLDNGSRKNGHKMILAAHSMGGLVALSAIGKLAAEGMPSSLRMYCSFSTPYGGDESARGGVKNAPVVVPVWRDIAANSDFLRKLQSRRLPEALPFYLFFTYNDPSTFKLGQSSDGSVTLCSQLVPAMQASAVKLFGFDEDHKSFLNSEEARETFLRLLEKASPARENVNIKTRKGG